MAIDHRILTMPGGLFLVSGFVNPPPPRFSSDVGVIYGFSFLCRLRTALLLLDFDDESSNSLRALILRCWFFQQLVTPTRLFFFASLVIELLLIVLTNCGRGVFTQLAA